MGALSYAAITFTGDGFSSYTTVYNSGEKNVTVSGVYLIITDFAEPPSRPGYKFLYWKYNDSKKESITLYGYSTQSSAIEQAKTFVAEWEPITYAAITFTGDGFSSYTTVYNSGEENVTVSGDYLIITDFDDPPSRTGYNFSYWKYNNSKIKSITLWGYSTQSSAIKYAETFVAEWELATIYAAIVFSGEGITTRTTVYSSSDSGVSRKGSYLTITLPEETQTDYEFNGWIYNGALYSSTIQLYGYYSTSEAKKNTYSLVASWSPSTRFRIYNGSKWMSAVPYIYNGSSWKKVQGKLYYGNWV